MSINLKHSTFREVFWTSSHAHCPIATIVFVYLTSVWQTFIHQLSRSTSPASSSIRRGCLRSSNSLKRSGCAMAWWCWDPVGRGKPSAFTPWWKRWLTVENRTGTLNQSFTCFFIHGMELDIFLNALTSRKEVSVHHLEWSRSSSNLMQ